MARRPPRGVRAYVIAILLTVLIPGLGHLYARSWVRGLIWLAGAVGLTIVFYGRDDLETPLSFTLFAVLTVLAAADVVYMLRTP